MPPIDPREPDQPRTPKQPDAGEAVVYCQPRASNPATCDTHDQPLMEGGRCPRWDKRPASYDEVENLMF